MPGEKCNILGYADDTTLFVKDDRTIIEFFEVINKFEKATNSKLNMSKTKLYGYGLWKDRNIWPVSNLKLEKEYFCTLGINFSNDYYLAVEKTWTSLANKVKKRVQMLNCRDINMYQRAITVNSLITSKLWYAAHIYPLPLKFSVEINKYIFSFIWGNKSETIKRIILYNSKDAGGLNLMNIYVKAKCILAHTTIKMFCKSKETSIIKYYLAMRLNNLFDISTFPNEMAYVSTPYYEFILGEIRTCYHIKNFPNLNSKTIYRTLLPNVKTVLETERYINFNWNNIWPNLNNKFISISDRLICFKFLHEILANRKRLAQVRIRPSPNCDVCNVEESNVHMFYFCTKIKNTVLYIF